MKKVLVLLLTLVLAVSMWACGDGDTENPSTPATSSPGSESTSQNELALGTVSGQTYENKFIGLGLTLDDNWTFFDEDEIKEINNIATDAMGDELKEMIANATILYDMYAMHSNGMNSINANLEKMNNLQLKALDIATVYESQAPILEENLEDFGYTNFQYEITTIQIDGETFDAMRCSATINGITMYQVLFGIKCDGYLANLTVATFNENTTGDILSKFYIIK